METTIWAILNLVVSAIMKMSSPWLKDFNVLVCCMRIYVGIERAMEKAHVVKNIDWDHFVSKS